MIERLTRSPHIRALLCAGMLSPIALGACSVSEETVNDTIEVGVDCPNNTRLEVLSAVFNQRGLMAGEVEVACQDSSGVQYRPASMELLEAPDVTVLQSQHSEGDELLQIDISYQQGGGFDGIGDQDPRVSLIGDSILLYDIQAVEDVRTI